MAVGVEGIILAATPGVVSRRQSYVGNYYIKGVYRRSNGEVKADAFIFFVVSNTGNTRIFFTVRAPEGKAVEFVCHIYTSFKDRGRFSVFSFVVVKRIKFDLKTENRPSVFSLGTIHGSYPMRYSYKYEYII